MEVSYIANLKLNKEESRFLSKTHSIFLDILSEMENNDDNLITGTDSGDTWSLTDIQRAEEILSFLEYNNNYTLEQGESS